MRMEATPIRILAVDDHPLMREGIAALVKNEADMKLVGEAANGREALDQYRSHHPDITLMDLQMPTMGGIETIIAIRKEFPNARIIVLTMYEGDVQMLRALKAGARGYVLKGHVHEALLDTIRAVHSGQKRICPEVAAELADHAGEERLTEREIDVLRTGTRIRRLPNNFASQMKRSRATLRTYSRSCVRKIEPMRLQPRYDVESLDCSHGNRGLRFK